MVKVFHTGAFLALSSSARCCAPVDPREPDRSATAPGYWLAGADGGVFSFDAPFYGSGVHAGGAMHVLLHSRRAHSMRRSGVAGLRRHRLAMAIGCSTGTGTRPHSAKLPHSTRRTALAIRRPVHCGPGSRRPPLDGDSSSRMAAGRLSPCGDAPQIFSGLDQYVLAAPVVGITATLDGKGYWMVSSDGGVFAVGDAPFEGSLGGAHLNAPVVGIAPTRDDKGYWLVASDGGVFAFGDAVFHGSMGGSPLDAPVVGVAAAPDGAGYWLAAADGGVFSFGSAPFEGSMGGKSLQGPVVGIATYAGATAG